MPVISTRRYSTTGSSSYLPPSIGGTTSSLANLGKTTTSSGYSSSTYRSNSLSNTYSTSYSSGIGSGTSSSSSSSYLSRPSYRSGLYSSSSSLGGSTRTSSYLTGGNNDSTATLSSRFGVSNYKYTRSSSDRDTITSTRGLTGKTHFNNNNNINNNNISYNNTNTTTTTTTTTTSIATGLKSINNKTKTIQTKPPIGTFSKRQSLRENRSRDNSTTRPLSIPDISKIGVTSKSDSDCNANNSSKFTSSLSSSTSTGNEDRGNKRSISSSLSSSSLALQVATSALDLQEKYSPAYYIPKCELSRSRSLSEATPNSISNDYNLTNSSSNVNHLLQQKENKEQHQQQQQVADDIDCVYKPKSSSPSLSSISASKDNSSSQTVNKVNIQLCDAADPASSILTTSTNNYLNHIKVYDCSAFIKNTLSATNNNYSLHIENHVKTKNDANALYLTDCNATYTPFAEHSKSSNINSNDAINKFQVNSIVRKAVDAIRASTASNNTTANSTITKTIATNLTTTTITTTTIATKTKSTITKNVAAKYMKNSSVSLGEELKGNYVKTHDEQNSESNESTSKTTSCKINKLKDSHSHIMKTIDNNEILGKLLPSTSTQNTMKKGQQSKNSTNHNDGNIIDSLNKPSSASSCSSNTSSSSLSSAVPSKTQNSITNSIKFKIPNPSNNSIIQAAKLNLKSTKQYLSSKFDDKLIINSSYSYNLKTTNNCNKINLKNKSKKCETIVTTNSSPSAAVSKITKSFFSSNCGNQNQNQNNLNLNNKKKNCANDNSNSQNLNSTKSNFLTTTNKNNLSDSHLEFSKNKQRPSGSSGGVTSYGGVIGGNNSQTHIHSYSVGGYVPSTTTSVSKIDDTIKKTVNTLSGTNLKNVSNTYNNNNTSSLIKNFGNDNNTKNNNRSLNNSPFFPYHTQITSTFKDENFLKREYELARSQVIGSAETKRKGDDKTTTQKLDEENSVKIEQINSNQHLNNSQNKYSKKLIKPLVHKTTNNKFTAKLAKIMTNNNMNCMQNNHEILDDIKFIDSDDTDRSNQQQQQQQQQKQQQTKLNSINETIINPYRNNQETSSVSSSSSSPMNVRKDMNLVNNKNMIISSHNSSSLYLSKVKNTGILSTPSSTNKDELLSENRKIDATSTLTNKFSSLTDLKRAPQSIRSSQSNSNNYCSSSSTSNRNVDNSRKFNFISKTNIRQVVSSSSTISTATMSMATTTTTTSIKHPVSSTTVAPSTVLSSSPSSSAKSSSVVMINNYANNISSSRDSTPSNSPQFLRRRNHLNSSNNTGTNTSSYITKHSSQQEINEILPSLASTSKSTTTVSSASASASSILTDKNMSNKLCDIEESVRNTSIRSALPSSPTLSRYWDREGRSAISSRNISDGDDYAATKSSVFNSSESYDKIPSEQREGLCGLRNIGNTCFMNSVIQCLSHTRELTKFLKNQVRLKSTSKDEQILYEFAKLIREMWSPNTRSVTPHELKSAFSSKHRMYSGYNQQDAQEFLRFFLDSLHCALNTGAKADQLNIDDSLSDNKKADLTWEHYSKIENSVIKDLFVGQLKSSLKCTTCGNTSVTFDPFWDLSVPLPSSSRCKLDACLDLFIREEVLDGDEMPTCSKCQTRRKCTKRLTIQRFPKYLVIHLKRFSETRWSKLSNIVEFPTGEKELNMSPYASTSSSNSLYSLYGISNHMGSTAGGHYVALCKHPVTKRWHEFNDNVVSDEVSENILVSSSAYLLFYERAY